MIVAATPAGSSAKQSSRSALTGSGVAATTAAVEASYRLMVACFNAGNDPAAVDTAGVSVVRLRYAAVMICGLLSGIAGAYLLSNGDKAWLWAASASSWSAPNSPAAAEMTPAYPLWLDVRPSGYPVFNVQRKFGGPDGECTWPKEKCADFDPFGKKFVGQGEPGNGKGEDWEFPAKGEPFGKAGPFNGGTIIGMGGHVHPGGIQNEIDLVRGKKKKRIYTGVAKYWHPKNKKKGGGPADSWDFSMPVVGLPFWGVRVKPGDKLRSNATYDTKRQSTYENMGIAVSLLVPDDPKTGKPRAPGVNPFTTPLDRSRDCLFRGGIRAPRPVLCDKGVVTHVRVFNGDPSDPHGHALR